MKNRLFLAAAVFVFLSGSSFFSFSATQKKKSIAYEVRKVMKDRGVDEAIAHYKHLKKISPEKYDFGVDQLHKMGQQLFNQGKREESLKILEFNAEMFPDVPKVYNILAQVYFYTGRREKSIRSFTKYSTFGELDKLRDIIFKKKLFFVPDDFEVPLRLETETFRIRPLEPSDVDLDYKAVMSSVEHLQGVFGRAGWPSEDLTKEEDLKSLEMHHKQFQRREAFTFTVMNLEETECLGCVYIYPSRLDSYNAEITMWVSADQFAKGLDPILFQTVKEWVQKDWPFEKVVYLGREMDWKDFFAALEEQDKKYKR
jgi:tetratricopeptide (TPR) repeat protein